MEVSSCETPLNELLDKKTLSIAINIYNQLQYIDKSVFTLEDSEFVTNRKITFKGKDSFHGVYYPTTAFTHMLLAKMSI